MLACVLQCEQPRVCRRYCAALCIGRREMQIMGDEVGLEKSKTPGQVPGTYRPPTGTGPTLAPAENPTAVLNLGMTFLASRLRPTPHRSRNRPTR